MHILPHGIQLPTKLSPRSCFDPIPLRLADGVAEPTCQSIQCLGPFRLPDVGPCDWVLGDVAAAVCSQPYTLQTQEVLRCVNNTSAELLQPLATQKCCDLLQKWSELHTALHTVAEFNCQLPLVQPALDALQSLQTELQETMEQHQEEKHSGRPTFSEDLYHLRANLGNFYHRNAMHTEMMQTVGYTEPICSERCARCLYTFKAVTGFSLEGSSAPLSSCSVNQFRIWLHVYSSRTQVQMMPDIVREEGEKMIEWMKIALRHGAWPAVHPRIGPRWGAY